jgi:hypothetical protein
MLPCYVIKHPRIIEVLACHSDVVVSASLVSPSDSSLNLRQENNAEFKMLSVRNSAERTTRNEKGKGSSGALTGIAEASARSSMTLTWQGCQGRNHFLFLLSVNCSMICYFASGTFSCFPTRIFLSKPPS